MGDYGPGGWRKKVTDPDFNDGITLVTFMNQLYVYLMEKYNWSPEQIHEMEASTLIELEFGEWKEKQPEPLATIDTILGF